MVEVRQRLLFVLMALIVYRIGTFIPVPGINPEAMSQLFNQNSGTILGVLICFPAVHWSASVCLLWVLCLTSLRRLLCS